MSTIKVDTITNVGGSVDTGVALSVPLKILETAEPLASGSPVASYGYIWGESDGKLYFKSDDVGKMELSGSGVSTGSTNTFTAAQAITGGADAIQLTVKGYGTQTTNTELFLVEKSDNSDLFSVDNSGNVRLKKDSSVFSMGIGTGSPTVGDFTITHDGTTGATLAATPIIINSTGDLTLDSTTDIVLDADGDDIKFKAGSGDTTGLSFTNSSGSWTIKPGTSDSDLIFAGNDGGGNITALTLDMSAAGAATFNSSITTGTTVISDDSIVMTPTTNDTATISATTHGALAITTVDNAAAAANITITADGTVDIDSAGVLTLDSGAAINIEPAAGSAILLDGTISIDAGVVAGATSITSTTFAGALTGNVTGNVSGTAATVTTGAQGNISSLGTLTALTVDDVNIDGKVITMTGSTDDTTVLTAGTHGTLSIVTTDNDGAAANIQITADGTAELAGTTVTLDSSGGITLDADNGTITFADNGSSLGTITSGGYSGNAATATLATTVTITDNEITSETNAIIFTAGGDLDGGNLGLESDGDLTYTPNTGTLACTTINPATQANTFDMNGQVLDNAKLQSYKETIVTDSDYTIQAVNSGTVTLDLAYGNVFYSVLKDNGSGGAKDVTTIAFTNMVAGQSVTWIAKNHGSLGTTTNILWTTVTGGTIKWIGNIAPANTIVNDAIDIFTFFYDGTNIYGMVAGKNFS